MSLTLISPINRGGEFCQARNLQPRTREKQDKRETFPTQRGVPFNPEGRMNLPYTLPEVFGPPLEPLQGKGAGFCLWTPTSNFKSVYVTSCITAGPKDFKGTAHRGEFTSAC